MSLADSFLEENQSRSFCWQVPAEVMCVIGKQHTPQTGATFRSLSHHLALYPANEIEGRWINASVKVRAADRERPKTLNLLLLPWPLEVETNDFHEAAVADILNDDPPPGFFRYQPSNELSAADFRRKFQSALEEAKRQAGKVDAVVLPECSVNLEQYAVAEEIAFSERMILICGLRDRSENPERWDDNLSVLQVSGAARGDEITVEDLRFVQSKHHRWFLDRQQIVSYQLGGHIPASRGYWEHIAIRERVVHFVTLKTLTWSVLICEDLARQDPAANLIRAVGPNLLIALLMDGPQLGNRWPARYASVLADDPGTSVLTLTSLGMSKRSRPFKSPGERVPPSTVIALWRDAVQGEVQIALDPGDDACILSLECRLRTEYCADGRGDGGQSCYPTYAGYCSFKSGS